MNTEIKTLKDFFLYKVNNCIKNNKEQIESYETFNKEDIENWANERVIMTNQILYLLEMEEEELAKSKEIIESVDDIKIWKFLIDMLISQGYNHYVDTTYMSTDALESLSLEQQELFVNETVKTIPENAFVHWFGISKNNEWEPILMVDLYDGATKKLIPIELFWKKQDMNNMVAEMKDEFFNFSWEEFFERLSKSNIKD